MKSNVASTTVPDGQKSDTTGRPPRGVNSTPAKTPKMPSGTPPGLAIGWISPATSLIGWYLKMFWASPLAMPLGGVQAETVSYKGLGLRVVYDYNSSTKTNIVSIDMLFGVKTLDATRAVRVLG